MSVDKHTPDSLKYQWRLYGLVTRSDWATSLDKSIAYEIIDNYRKDFGTSRTALRYLEMATGATRPNIIASTRRIVEFGPFSIARLGAGTRPTEYNLHFEKVAEKPSGIVGDTSSNDLPRGIADDTSCGIAGDTSNGPSGIVGDTESVLPVASYKDGLQDRMIDFILPVVGLSATTAKTGEGKPFDRLWNAYGVRKKRAQAKLAFDSIADDIDLDELIAAAKAWRSAWATQNKPDAPRKHLHTWLKDECFLEDAPTAYKPKERKQASPSETKPVNTVRRDLTVTGIFGTETGVRMHVDFNDCEPGDVPSTTIDYPHPAKLYEAAGRGGRHVIGTRLWLDIDIDQDENETYRFSIHPG